MKHKDASRALSHGRSSQTEILLPPPSSSSLRGRLGPWARDGKGRLDSAASGKFHASSYLMLTWLLTGGAVLINNSRALPPHFIVIPPLHPPALAPAVFSGGPALFCKPDWCMATFPSFGCVLQRAGYVVAG